jgi:hypothetical protein
MIDEPVDAEVLGTGVVPNCKTAQMKEHSRDKRFWEQVYILANTTANLPEIPSHRGHTRIIETSPNRG